MRIGLFFLLLGIITSCMSVNSQELAFKKVELVGDMKIDTLERYHNDSLLLVNIIRNGFLGNFKMYFGIIRNFNSESVLYQAVDLDPYRVSFNYIAQVDSSKFGIINWGWYNIDDKGDIITSLPYEGELLDSLKANYSPKYYINKNNRGDFFLYENGKLIKKINYGNLVMKDSTIEFDKFDSKVLKLEGDKIKKVSLAPDDIFKNGKGLYYIAKPGLGVIRKYDKLTIIKTLMSYQAKSDCPVIIEIKQ